LFGKLISNNKLQLYQRICSLPHSHSQLFYLRISISKRLTRQIDQPSVMTFQMR